MLTLEHEREWFLHLPAWWTCLGLGFCCQRLGWGMARVQILGLALHKSATLTCFSYSVASVENFGHQLVDLNVVKVVLVVVNPVSDEEQFLL
jgi:hypothetical protein